MERENFLIRQGAIIAKLREERGYSQTRFAELIGISRGQLYRYELGQREIGTYLMGSIADMLNVKVPDLMNSASYLDMRERPLLFNNKKNTHTINDGRVIRVKHIMGMKNLDFLDRKSLWLYINNDAGLNYCNRALHTFIGPNHVNNHVIEPLGLAYTVEGGIEIRVQDIHEPEKEYEVSIICDIIF